MELSARRGQDLFIRHKGHFAFHYFRPVLLRMINSGRRVPLRRFRALFHRDSRNGGEKPDKIYSLRAYDEHVHVERLHISLYACQRSRRGPLDSLRSPEKSTTPIPTSGHPIVSAGRATDSYEFGWHPVLNKSRTRTLSGHKIYGTSRKTCKRAAEFYFGKNSLRQNGV